MIAIALNREDELALIHMKNSSAFQLLKELIERDKIRPIERKLIGDSGNPLSDIAEVRYLQGQRRGLKEVFSYLESVVKEKSHEKDV